MGEQVTILKTELECLQNAQLLLDCLEEVGVDNWDGWGEALQLRDKYLEDEK